MRLSSLLLVGFVLTFLGCAPGHPAAPATTAAPVVLENGEPSTITVQHCLIGFTGSVGDKTIGRSKESAAKLAAELLEKANSGEDFDTIVKTYTDDSHPGIYQMSNSGVPEDTRAGVYSRDKMVPAFGNVGFKLEVGQYGMSEHDPIKSPFGWHLIKRLK